MMEEIQCPRVLIVGTASGCGKTTMTCSILSGFLQQNKSLSALKCGPDYIDPMFHRSVLHIPTGNLDSFFCDTQQLTNQLLGQQGENHLTVVEGVMGFYDGQSMASLEGSSYDIGKKLDIPTVLVVNGKGAAHSIIPMIQGFLTYQADHTIQGVLLNQMSKATYDSLKPIIEEKLLEQTGRRVSMLGYLPKLPQEFVLESRHLGLVLPNELEQIQEKMDKLGKIALETIDFPQLEKLSHNAPPFLSPPTTSPITSSTSPKRWEKERKKSNQTHQTDLVIAVAKDEAFCFYYEENLQLLEEMGAKIEYFSPLRDHQLPKNCSGLYLGGGYPELYGEKLEENKEIKEEIRHFLEEKGPCIAECGGFMYLTQSVDQREMVGFLQGHCEKQETLGPFGYVTLVGEKDSLLGPKGTRVKGHEFHYYRCIHKKEDRQTAIQEESQEKSIRYCQGEDFQAVKPNGKQWRCGYAFDHFYGGFPHLSFQSEPKVVQSFLERCRVFQTSNKNLTIP